MKIAVQRVRLGGEEFRVIRPAAPLNNGALYETGDRYEMYVDRADGRRIGTLWLLAARSPRSLVYLPMRATPTAPGTGWRDEKPLDLVLAHRSVQFRPSRWKQLRERISAGNAPRELGTASVPESDVLPDQEIDYVAPSDRRSWDLLRQRVHAETLFLTGNTKAFREVARHVFAVTKEGPPAAATELYLPGPGLQLPRLPGPLRLGGSASARSGGLPCGVHSTLGEMSPAQAAYAAVVLRCIRRARRPGASCMIMT